ncbi:hypothetical protein ROHU_020501 [Labeo rohita]|uniref:Uncharacterized protein n=1 Tax=Labeo rohita TaxID=84645 RepID=A0A498MYJ8_LABRO|nr:hypothetical protein ROHU_020501 [Labeo rohita]
MLQDVRLAGCSFEAVSLTIVLRQKHFGLAVIQAKGKTNAENNESTGKAIKGQRLQEFQNVLFEHELTGSIYNDYGSSTGKCSIINIG